MLELKHTQHAVGQNAYHFVWKPKYGRVVFRDEYSRKVCEKALKYVAEKYNFTIHEMRVMPDHVHLFVEIPHTMSISKAFQLLKGVSARKFFERCDKWRAFFSYDGRKTPHLWSSGKFYRSVGNVRADVIEKYIAYSQGKWDFDYLNTYQSKLDV